MTIYVYKGPMSPYIQIMANAITLKRASAGYYIGTAEVVIGGNRQAVEVEVSKSDRGWTFGITTEDSVILSSDDVTPRGTKRDAVEGLALNLSFSWSHSELGGYTPSV